VQRREENFLLLESSQIAVSFPRSLSPLHFSPNLLLPPSSKRGRSRIGFPARAHPPPPPPPPAQVVGTPGRMIDLMNGGILDLSEIKYLVRLAAQPPRRRHNHHHHNHNHRHNRDGERGGGGLARHRRRRRGRAGGCDDEPRERVRVRGRGLFSRARARERERERLEG
jgi:hypothetical protein